MTARQMYELSKNCVNIKVEKQYAKVLYDIKESAEYGSTYMLGDGSLYVQVIDRLEKAGYKVEEAQDNYRYCHRITWDFSEEDKFKLDGPEYQAAVKEMADQ